MKRIAVFLMAMLCAVQSWALNTYQNSSGDLMITDRVLSEKEMADGGWFLEKEVASPPPPLPAPPPKKTGNQDVDYWSGVIDKFKRESSRGANLTGYDIEYLIKQISSSLELAKTDSRIPTSYRAEVVSDLTRIKVTLEFHKVMNAAVNPR